MFLGKVLLNDSLFINEPSSLFSKSSYVEALYFISLFEFSSWRTKGIRKWEWSFLQQQIILFYYFLSISCVASLFLVSSYLSLAVLSSSKSENSSESPLQLIFLFVSFSSSYCLFLFFSSMSFYFNKATLLLNLISRSQASSWIMIPSWFFLLQLLQYCLSLL